MRKHSEVRPAVEPDDRRHAMRWASDAQIEILSPIQAVANALDVSATGIQLSLDGWLSTGTLCDLRITTHTGRAIFKRAPKYPDPTRWAYSQKHSTPWQSN